MPWKERYTISDERSLERVEWPDGYRAAALVTVDLAARSGPDGIGDAELAADDAEFGRTVGLPRLLDLFDRYAVRATFAVPAVTAEAHADTMRELVARGHEVAAHGLRHEDVSRLDSSEESRRLLASIEALTKVTGTRPAGWFALPRQQDRYPGGQIRGDFQALMMGGTWAHDPDAYIRPFFHSKSKGNYGKYANTEVDRLLDESRVTVDEKKRVEMWRRIQEIMADDIPIIWALVQAPRHEIIRDHVKGYDFMPDTSRQNLRSAWIDK